MPILVPPGGFAGFAQQSPATQTLFQRAGRIGGQTTQRRRRKRKANGTAKRARSSRASSPRKPRRARLVKGSAAAKRHMARLRAKRKR